MLVKTIFFPVAYDVDMVAHYDLGPEIKLSDIVGWVRGDVAPGIESLYHPSMVPYRVVFPG